VCEGYIPDGGWIIGAGEEYDDLSYQDQVESQAIYNMLEQEVVPLFYSRPKTACRGAGSPHEKHHQMVCSAV
jgi:glucan phosphorylase